MKKIVLLYYVLILVLVVLGAALVTYTLGRTPGNFNTGINSFVTAVYFTIVTISTVGYGDITPVSTIARLFVIALIIIGLGTFAFVLTSLSSDIMSKRLESFAGRISSTEKRLLHNHIVLIGYGPTNVALLGTLKQKSGHLIVVSPDKVVIDQLSDEGYKAFVVDVTSEKDMSSLNLDKAQRIIIDMRHDSLTVYVSLLVKNITKKDNIVIVAETPTAEKQLRSIGMKNIINPGEIAAQHITKNLS